MKEIVHDIHIQALYLSYLFKKQKNDVELNYFQLMKG